MEPFRKLLHTSKWALLINMCLYVLHINRGKSVVWAHEHGTFDQEKTKSFTSGDPENSGLSKTQLAVSAIRDDGD